MKLSLSFWQRLMQLASLFVIGVALTAGAGYLLQHLSANTLAIGRITIVMQDLLAFILPAIITALLLTRLPADFLRLRRLPRGRQLLLYLSATVVLQPIIEGINKLCEILPWPEAILRMEHAAQNEVLALIGPVTSANIIISLLIIALLTGLAEEIFFRGALQGILQSRPMSTHLAIWLTALIFALMHGQMVGLIPRTLLGAFFGYATVRTDSLWTAIACHALNNALALTFVILG
ncbi:MAG: CPBP family intramembrane metalloprotease [Muribaculaceae bacterium]|nr:CPBP family intramembrane metalloprotease [Muribaculaceae bacterium]